jgi:hypothetical protein
MDKTIRRYTSLDEMKADEYRYWQSRPVHERVAAISKLTQEQYAMKGIEIPPRMDKTYVRRLKWVGGEEIPFPEAQDQ